MVVAALGTPEEACHLGRQALGSGGLVPSNIWRAVELDGLLRSRYGKVADVEDLHDHYLAVKREVLPAGTPQ